MSDLPAPLDPLVGSPFSVSQFRERVLNPLRQSDLTLEERLAALELAIAGLPSETRSATIPGAAREGDHWYDTTEAAYPIFRVCKLTYTDNGTIEDNWITVKDPRAYSKAVEASDAAAAATQTTIGPDVPTSAARGWIWVDDSIAGQNKTYSCRTPYTINDTPIDPRDDAENSQWTLITDTTAALLSAAIDGLKDKKINLFFQSNVPEEADARDQWIDEDTGAGYATKLGYSAEDGAIWSDVTAYTTGQYVREGAEAYYIALQNNTNSLPSTHPADWSFVDNYADLTAFREHFWLATADLIAREYADAALTIASGKSQNYYSPTMPNPAVGEFIRANDLWIDEANEIGYLCIVQYGHDQGVLETNWRLIPNKDIQDQLDNIGLVLDGKTETKYSGTVPTAADFGDVWCDTNDGNVLLINKFPYPYVAADGTAWSSETLPVAAGRIVTHGTSFYRANVSTSNQPPHADWTLVGERTIDAWVIGPSYASNTNVTHSGAIWRALRDNSGEEPTGGSLYWATVSGTATDADIFKAQCWAQTRDSNAKRVADDAQAIADRKAESFISDAIPPYASQGDIWTDTRVHTDLPAGQFKQWKCKSVNGYDYRPAAYGGVFEDDWAEHVDSYAQKLAADAVSTVDKKRTTFYTVDFAEPAIKWPGSGDSGNHIPIDYWWDLPLDDSNHIARQGDLWINLVGGVQYTRICAVGYKGDTSDPGALANWKAVGAEGTVVAAVAAGMSTAYLRDGTQELTNPINFAPGGTPFSNQDFKGRHLNLTGSATIAGDLTVNGTSTSVNTNTLEVADSIVKVAKNNTANTLDLGLIGQHQPSATPVFTGLLLDTSADRYLLFDYLTAEPTTTIDPSAATPAALAVKSLKIGNAFTSTLGLSQTSTEGYMTVDSSDMNIGLDLDGKRLQNVGDPSLDKDTVPKKWLDDHYLKVNSSGTPATAGTAAVANLGASNGNAAEVGATISGTYQRWAHVTAAGKLTAMAATANRVLTTDANGETSTEAKATAFNKAFGTASGEVAEGNHAHTLSALTLTATTGTNSGYFDLGSLRLQWFRGAAASAEGTQTDNFPHSMGSVYTIQVTTTGDSSDTADDLMFQLTSWSSSSVTVMVQRFTAGGAGTDQYPWYFIIGTKPS